MFFRKLAANQCVLWEGIYSGAVPSSQAFISIPGWVHAAAF